MTRKSWVQHPVTHELIPKEEYYQDKAPSGPFVLGDIQPYKSMIDGSMIQGRAQHRAHLKQHGCIEVGNEKIKPREVKSAPRDDIKRDLYKIANSRGW